MLEVRPGVYFVESENRGRYPYSHSLFLKGDTGLLVDTGAGPVLKKLPSRPDRVVLSHYHRDHVTFNHYFDYAAFAAHRFDAEGIETREGFYQLSGLDRVDIESYWKMVKQVDFSATKVDEYIDEGDSIDLGRFKVKVLHLPGHTPGHCGLFLEDYNLLFAADIDLTRFGPWYGNPSSDPEMFKASIERLRKIKPDILITGHSRPITKNIDKKLAAYSSVLDQREEALVRILQSRPAGLEALVTENIIYRNHYDLEVLRYFERVMIEKHLESLIKRAIVIKTEDGLYEVL